MKNNALISIIIPVYNTFDDLPMCLQSVLTQSHESLEILLVDDGSTDGSGELCDQFAASDLRIKVIHQPNSGVSQARKKGLAHATGQYAMFVDSDDWLERNALTLLQNEMQMENADLIIAGYQQHPIVKRRPWIEKRQVLHSLQSIGQFLLHQGLCVAVNGVCAKMYKTDLLRSAVFEENISFGEDGLMLLSCLSLMNKAILLPDVVYHYRMREGSLSYCKHANDISTLLYLHQKRLEYYAPLRISHAQEQLNSCFLNVVIDRLNRIVSAPLSHAEKLAQIKQYTCHPMVQKAAEKHDVHMMDSIFARWILFCILKKKPRWIVFTLLQKQMLKNLRNRFHSSA